MLTESFTTAKIARIEVGTLEGKRPRSAGCNARLDDHGITVQTRFARVTTDDGLVGFGQCRATSDEVRPFVGRSLADAFGADQLVSDDWIPLEFALWDLLGHYARQPVYALLAARSGRSVSGRLQPRCYDTSLYIDDLKTKGEADAAELLAEEAAAGRSLGHRAFKIKIGRGARHMPLEVGTRRDIAVIRAVRAEVGPEAIVMVDSNNGLNLNLTKRILTETSECNLYWFEEAFHEDDILYADLQAWLSGEGLSTLIADGEGLASPRLMEWAQQGVIDVVQYDIIDRGISGWVRTGEQLDAHGARSAPHVYGGHFGQFACAHLSTAIDGFEMVEWDQVTTPGLDTSGYAIREGRLVVPESPGFGLQLDSQRFETAVTSNGFALHV